MPSNDMTKSDASRIQSTQVCTTDNIPSLKVILSNLKRTRTAVTCPPTALHLVPKLLAIRTTIHLPRVNLLVVEMLAVARVVTLVVEMLAVARVETLVERGNPSKK
jgi:hypothetical protein